MNFETYQKLAVRTAAPLDGYDERVERGILGLVTEVGELAQLRKKDLYQGHHGDWKTGNIVREMGDILWYLAVLANDLDLGLNTIALCNVAKLQERFPHGFDPEQSVHHRP